MIKRLFSVFAFVCFYFLLNAQAPQKLSYQAIIRNSSNALASSTAIGMRVSILQGSALGTEVYKETYSPNPITNANGLVTIEIGGGTPVIGSFSAINWANGPYFIKVETDPTGGSNFTINGTTQLLSVPFALQANSTTEDNINFPFPKQSLSTVYRKLFNNSFSVPANKLLYLMSAHASIVNQLYNYSFKIDTSTINFVDTKTMASFLPAGTTLTSNDTSVYIYGYLIDQPTVVGIFRDISSQAYTVPAGKTLYMSFYDYINPYSGNNSFYINNNYYSLWGGGDYLFNTPMIFTSGTTIKGLGKMSGYLR